mgnify:CR=1 FL=1
MSLMGTPKPLQITVALPSASAQSPILRKWIYKEDEACLLYTSDAADE